MLHFLLSAVCITRNLREDDHGLFVLDRYFSKPQKQQFPIRSTGLALLVKLKLYPRLDIYVRRHPQQAAL